MISLYSVEFPQMLADRLDKNADHKLYGWCIFLFVHIYKNKTQHATRRTLPHLG